MTTVIGLTLLGPSGSVAQIPLADDLPEVTREEWRARVRASRERAHLMRREGRGFMPQAPTPQEIAEEASRRVLEDDSLRPGDIVSTSRGLFEFRGAPGGERTNGYFVRIR